MNAAELQNTLSETRGHEYQPVGPRVEKVRQLFAGLPPGQKVLDVGCATGGILAPLVGRHEIHGVDVSESLVQKATQLGLKAVKHDVESGPMPFAEGSFDAVFCGEAIEHLVDTDWLMAELNRVLRIGGKLVLTYPNIRTALSVVMMLFLDMPPLYSARYRAPHFRDFTLRTIKIVLRNHGFTLDKAIGSAFYLPRIGEFGSRLATFFPSWADTGIVMASKVKGSIYRPEDAISADPIY